MPGVAQVRPADRPAPHQPDPRRFHAHPPPLPIMSACGSVMRITFSSKLEPRPLPANAMVASLPTTCAATISIISLITGLTFPGIIDDPGCVAGMEISPTPQRGPDASQRMSLAIFESEIAMVLS